MSLCTDASTDPLIGMERQWTKLSGEVLRKAEEGGDSALTILESNVYCNVG